MSSNSSPRPTIGTTSGLQNVNNTEESQKRVRGAKRVLHDIMYPHNIHPALVPGVSIEEQKVKYSVDKTILGVVGGFVIAFVVWGVLAPEQVFNTSSTALDWVMRNLGWIFTSLATFLMFLLLILAFSKYGKIPLGVDGEKPEFSTISWSAMLFGAGIGIGLIFFGPYEPLTHYLSPRPGAYAAASDEAVLGALAQSAMHWGLNAWAIYAIVGLCVAYVSFRRGRVPLMSSIVMPLFGNRSVDSAPARVIDGLAIIATLFGTAATLGIGALQIGQGVEIVSGWSTAGNTAALVIIVVLSIGTVFSAVSGVAKGVRWLSNINLVLALGIAIFFFVIGPTALLANMMPAVIIEYLDNTPDMLSANMGEGEDMVSFLSSWTTFYWAWWVSWSPFVGVFVAKISRGRTIRQFILGVLLIPSVIIIAAFTILGGTTIWLQRRDRDIAPDGTIDSMPAAEDIFFNVLDHFPGSNWMAPLVIVMLVVFFITTADSASLVNSQLTQRGNPQPKPLVTVFWVICMAGIAVVILMSGGKNALQGLQNLITITALPFAVIIVLMCIALIRELRDDPASIRHYYEHQAVSNAVIHGVRDYGDNFALTVEPTAGDSDYATGGEFDSAAPEVTDWYARTDEEGHAIGYDYEAGRYVDDDPSVADGEFVSGTAEDDAQTPPAH